MKKIIVSLMFLLPALAHAQYTRELSVEVDLALQTDSVAIGTVPANALVTMCVVHVDTTVTNADSVLVKLSGGQTYLLSYQFVEADAIGTDRVARPDKPTKGERDSVVLYYTTAGEAVTGRVRVYIEYKELH